MATDAQIAANCLNARKSTGPRSQAGKDASPWNALKSGAFTRQISICHRLYRDSSAGPTKLRSVAPVILSPASAVQSVPAAGEVDETNPISPGAAVPQTCRNEPNFLVGPLSALCKNEPISAATASRICRNEPNSLFRPSVPPICQNETNFSVRPINSIAYDPYLSAPQRLRVENASSLDLNPSNV